MGYSSEGSGAWLCGRWKKYKQETKVSFSATETGALLRNHISFLSTPDPTEQITATLLVNLNKKKKRKKGVFFKWPSDIKRVKHYLWILPGVIPPLWLCWTEFPQFPLFHDQSCLLQATWPTSASYQITTGGSVCSVADHSFLLCWCVSLLCAFRRHLEVEQSNHLNISYQYLWAPPQNIWILTQVRMFIFIF